MGSNGTGAVESDGGFHRLHRAIKRSDIATIRNALESGVSPNLTNRFGWTLLMIAAFQGTVEIGRLLISAGAEMNKATRYRAAEFPEQTALSSSIIGGHARFVELLIENGVDPDIGVPAETWLSMCHHDEKTMSAIARLLQECRARTAAAVPEPSSQG